MTARNGTEPGRVLSQGHEFTLSSFFSNIFSSSSSFQLFNSVHMRFFLFFSLFICLFVFYIVVYLCLHERILHTCKLHVCRLLFTGNVSNAIPFWSRRLIACVQTPPPPPSPPIFIEGRRSVQRLKIDLSISETFHENFPRILREVNVM